MARSVSIYVCQSCGAQTRQFFGRCNSCGSWNSLVEQSQPKQDGRRRRAAADPQAQPVARRSTVMAALGDQPMQRLGSGYDELDRVQIGRAHV